MLAACSYYDRQKTKSLQRVFQLENTNGNTENSQTLQYMSQNMSQTNLESCELVLKCCETVDECREVSHECCEELSVVSGES